MHSTAFHFALYPNNFKSASASDLKRGRTASNLTVSPWEPLREAIMPMICDGMSNVSGHATHSLDDDNAIRLNLLQTRDMSTKDWASVHARWNTDKITSSGVPLRDSRGTQARKFMCTISNVDASFLSNCGKASRRRTFSAVNTEPPSTGMSSMSKLLQRMSEIYATTLIQSSAVYSQFSHTRCPYLIQPSGSFLPYFDRIHSRLFHGGD